MGIQGFYYFKKPIEIITFIILVKKTKKILALIMHDNMFKLTDVCDARHSAGQIKGDKIRFKRKTW
jgi:hypothetical protein